VAHGDGHLLVAHSVAHGDIERLQQHDHTAQQVGHAHIDHSAAARSRITFCSSGMSRAGECVILPTDAKHNPVFRMSSALFERPLMSDSLVYKDWFVRF
jgi:hypothetical protein